MRPVGKHPIGIQILLLVALGMAGVAGCKMHRAEPLKNMLPPGRFPVMVVAHRGFSGSAPENTMIAFKKGMEAGSDMIELDVRLSKDGEVVVIHDETLERTTSGRGRVIDLTLDELKKLDAGSKFNSSFSGEKITTLREVLQLAHSHDQTLVNIELKKGDYGRWTIFDLADRALREVEKAGMAGRVLFSSFDPSVLERLVKVDARIWVAYLYSKPWNMPGEVTGGRPFSILNCRKTVLTRENISRAHQESIRIGVYTLNTEEEMEKFIDLKVDAIITDYPERLINILQKRHP
jgi:glycerophosphoryl diester phosphodiesterase